MACGYIIHTCIYISFALRLGLRKPWTLVCSHPCRGPASCSLSVSPFFGWCCWPCCSDALKSWISNQDLSGFLLLFLAELPKLEGKLNSVRWPTLLSNFLKLIWCVSILEDNDAGITVTFQRLKPDPELICWSRDHMLVAMITFAGLGVWCVGFPCCFFLEFGPWMIDRVQTTTESTASSFRAMSPSSGGGILLSSAWMC